MRDQKLQIFFFLYRIARIPFIFASFLRLWLDLNLLHRDKNHNICLVVDNLGEGGLEQVVMDLYKQYRASGRAAYIVCVNENVSEYISQLEDDPRHFRMIKRSTRAFLKFCRKNKIGTIHYHFSTFRMPLMRLSGMKLIYTIHNTYVWFSDEHWRNLRLSLWFCQEIIAVSDFVKRYFVEKTGIKRVKTIINGVNLATFGKTTQNTVHTREKLGLKSSDVVLLMAASFTDQKYHMALIGAMSEVRKRRSDIKVILCGPVLNKDLYRTIKRSIREFKLDNCVFLIDKIARNEMNSFLRTIPDAVILPSLYEGGSPPLSIVEALYCGIPAIMTDLDLQKTIFSDYITKVEPVFENLAKVPPIDIVYQIYNAKPSNHQDLVNKILSVQKLSAKNRVKLPNKVLQEIDLAKTTAKYLKLLK